MPGYDLVHQAKTWYVRHGGEVSGPFPAGIISSYLILGRIRFEDEVSLDGEHWQPLEARPELFPEIYRSGRPDPERLLAARRWHDERRPEDRRQTDAEIGVDDRRQHDRRRERRPQTGRRRLIGFDLDTIGRRLRHERRLAGMAALIVLIVVAGGLFYLAVRPSALVGQGRDCEALPAPGVDWNHCAKPRALLDAVDLSAAHLDNIDLQQARLAGARLVDADLSYANLSGADLRGSDLGRARLVGANLRDTDLRGSRLAGAELLYADLRGAILDETSLAGARLGHAIWVDGHLCAPASTGHCLTVTSDSEMP